jgi:fatty acid amide hydrolase 2
MVGPTDENNVREIDPLRSSVGVLAEAIRKRQVSARDVVDAHIAVLQRTQSRTNAVAVPRFEVARAEADAADARIAAASSDDRLPPLSGVPCTVKEMIGIAGMPHTAGLLARRGQRATATAPAAQRLIDAGAIVLATTNAAEVGTWIETNNRIYGLTRNAYDPCRTAGGSSGGEAVAVAVGGSPFGLGSDMGGSIRIPAFFNGVFGHKPTAGLIPNTGMFPDTTGDIGQLLTIGPLTRYAEDLMPVLKAIAGPDRDDPFVRTASLGDPNRVVMEGLSVVIGEDTSLVPAAKETRAARDRAAAALADAGAHVRHVSLRSMRRATELFLTCSAELGGRLDHIVLEAGSPPVTARNLLRRAGGHNFMTALTLVAERLPRSATRTRRMMAAARALTAEVEGVIGDGVMLHPPYRRTAPRHYTTIARPWLQSACSVFNVMGLPVTEVPLGLNRRGMPLGVQVAARPGGDHLTIAVAQVLQHALGGWTPPNHDPSDR